MSLGYWWAMAEAIGPHPFQSPPGECPACYRAALQQQNAWTAINPGWILLACAGFDVLLWYGIRLARRRGVLAIPPRALWWKNA